MRTTSKKGKIGVACLEQVENFAGVPTWSYSENYIEDPDVIIKEFGLEIPGQVAIKKIWLTVYDRPGANRTLVDVEIWDGEYGDDYPGLKYRGEQIFSGEGWDKRLEKWLGKALYMEVEYLLEDE